MNPPAHSDPVTAVVADAMLWYRRINIRKAVDGDTVEIYIDHGWNDYAIRRARFLDVDTPEVVGATKAEGLAAKLVTESWIAEHREPIEWPFVMWSQKTDSFGRYLVRLMCWKGHEINAFLVFEGWPA